MSDTHTEAIGFDLEYSNGDFEPVNANKVFVEFQEHEVLFLFAAVEYRQGPTHGGRVVKRLSVPKGAAREVMHRLMSGFADIERAAKT